MGPAPQAGHESSIRLIPEHRPPQRTYPCQRLAQVSPDRKLSYHMNGSSYPLKADYAGLILRTPPANTIADTNRYGIEDLIVKCHSA